MIDSPMLKHLSGYIGGQWCDADNGETFAVLNPANGKELARVPAMGEAETERAIAAARGAVSMDYDLDQRREWLTDIRDALNDEAEEIGRILCLEHGKPWKEAQGEVAYAAGFFDYCAQHLDELAPRKLSQRPKDCDWTVHFRPIGVAGLITPWNFPIGMIAKKLSAALAAGCPAVIKPASETPLTMIALFTLLHKRLDLPDGMVNLVMGSARAIGDTLCRHPDVPMISFTGSTGVGQHLISATADQVKKLALELGGNAPFIVFDDADLDDAVTQLIGNKFRGGGQTCVCANRVLVERGVADAFTEKLVDKVRALRVGDGMDDDIDIGPLINVAGFDKVHRHLKNAIDKGAEQVAGKAPDELDSGKGLFFPPAVVRGVTRDMDCCREETFGPLVPLVEFDGDDQAIAIGNDTEFGLAAYVFTADADRAARVIAQLRFGHVGHNTGTGPTPEAPFGGMKLSGFGREGGEEGLFEYVEPQTVPRGA
ncbi:MAG: aldehyde dehydrogenase family protein [Salinisphaeraceae bacterium]